MDREGVELLIAFLNTLHLPDGVDELAADGAGADDGRLEELRSLREGIRVLTRRDAPMTGEQRDQLGRADATLRGVPVVLRLPDVIAEWPHLVPIASGGHRVDEQIAGVADAFLRSTANGTFSRVKTCALPECQWAFYDASRNRSRRWCAMDGCGNRMKNRSYRARRAALA